jgi:hypothetical protein
MHGKMTSGLWSVKRPHSGPRPLCGSITLRLGFFVVHALLSHEDHRTMEAGAGVTGIRCQATGFRTAMSFVPLTPVA